MTEIKRYLENIPGLGNMTPTMDGDWVQFGDHAAIVSALQEQVRALAAENAQMLRLITDISENHDEYVNQDEYLYAGVPMDYVSEINMYVSRDVNAENPFEATDAAIREIRAQVADGLATEFGLIAQSLKPNSVVYRAAKSAEFKCVGAAAAIRAGEQS